MFERPGNGTKKIFSYAPAPKEAGLDDDDSAERSGQAIVALLREAASVARENCERAMERADQLSVELRAAEDRLRELESEVQHHKVRATQAEKWLLRVNNEIEEIFFGPDVASPSPQTAPSRQRNQ